MASAQSGRYNNTVALGYDAAGRLTTESLTVTFGQTTTYTVQSAYDAANRRTGITYPDGSLVARQYTARDQLAQIDYNSAMVATFAYDNGLRRTSRTLGDTPGTQTTWTFGRQDDLPTAISSDIAGASFSYTYDANKNKLTEGISSPMANYGFSSTTYDQADRLTAWNRTDGNLDQAWNLSLVGDWDTFTENLAQELRTHTTVHEIAAIDAAPIAHDATGNLTRNAGDTLDRYTWDFDNRLATADVDQDGTAECGYQYDALGRRVSKTIPDGEGSAMTVFVGTVQALDHSPHAMQVVAEYAADAASGSPASKFVYAEYVDEPVMMIACDAPTEAHYYYHQNALYSVAAITDASGTVLERYSYSAHGQPLFLDANANLLAPQASTIGNPYLFTGRRLDEETGLYYYRARMYDAELGRFVSRDPIGYASRDANLYRYCDGRPIVGRDPSGLTGTLPGPEMTRYLAYHCACICGPAANSAAPKANTDAQALLHQETFVPGDVLQDAEINPDGTLAGDFAPASAMRHCIASGLLAKSTSCECSACIGDKRELFQYLYGSDGTGAKQQSAAVTNRTIYNNIQGRLCAGCKGATGASHPRRIIYPVFEHETIRVENEKLTISDGDIVACCRKKLLAGELGLPDRGFQDQAMADDILKSLPAQPPKGSAYDPPWYERMYVLPVDLWY